MTSLATSIGIILGLLITVSFSPLAAAGGVCVDEELERFCIRTFEQKEGDCTGGGFGHEREGVWIAIVSALTVSSYCDRDQYPNETHHEGVSVRFYRDEPGPDVGVAWEECRSEACGSACEQAAWARWGFLNLNLVNLVMPCAAGLKPVTLQQLLP